MMHVLYQEARNEKVNSRLENIDDILIQTYSSYPIDFWDFRNMDVRSHVHGLHNYPATMIYPITQSIVNVHKEHQNLETFLDPYCGSGTGLVEAYLADFKTVYGTDLNPLARLMSRVKSSPIEPRVLSSQITNFIEMIEYNFNELRNVRDGFEEHVQVYLGLDVTERSGLWAKNAPSIAAEYLHENFIDMPFPVIDNLGYWFKPTPLLELQIIKSCICKYDIQDETNMKIRDFFWVTFSETVRQCSNTRNSEFKAYRIKVEKIPSFNPNVLQIFLNNLHKNEEKMNQFWELSQNKDYPNTNVVVFNNDARFLNDIPDNSVDLVVTSPPYGDSSTTVAYGQYSRPALEWIDLEQTLEAHGLDQKEIKSIDKKLLGGAYDKKTELSYTLNSPTLNSLISEVALVDNERAKEVYQFYVDLNESLKSVTKKTKPNSYQYWVVGNRTVKKVKLLTHQILIELGGNMNLNHVTTLYRSIPNKVMPHQNSPTNVAGELVSTMTDEHIVVFRNDI